jgi:hypothetical protein
MPISVAVKIQFFQSKFGYGDLDIALQPIILTAEQVAEYSLPRVPVKDSDKRKANWIATQGKGQVELDALEALHPGELERIVKEAVFVYHDPDLDRRAFGQKHELIGALDDLRDGVLAEHQAEIDDLRAEYGALRDAFSETRARFSELVAQFQAEIDAHKERMDAIRERGHDLYGNAIRRAARC